MALADLEQLRRAREAELALRMPVTGNRAEFLLPYYEMQSMQDLAGKRVLDICAGGSDLTAAFLSMGADAVALDLGYNDKRVHKKILAEGFNPPNPHFLTSIDEHPERYVGGSAMDLDFSDESFDAIFSFYGIFGVMDEEQGFLFEAMNEAIRVLKRGGKLQVGPLLEGDISDTGKANQRVLLERLRQREDLIIHAGHTQFPVESSGYYPVPFGSKDGPAHRAPTFEHVMHPSADYLINRPVEHRVFGRQLRKLVIKKRA